MTSSIECSNGRCARCDGSLLSGEPCDCSCHARAKKLFRFTIVATPSVGPPWEGDVVIGGNTLEQAEAILRAHPSAWNHELPPDAPWRVVNTREITPP